MKINDFLCKAAVANELKSSTKAEVIAEIVGLLIDAGEIDKKHKNKIIDALMARESVGSTAFGQGIAIPHAKSEYVSEMVSALAVSKKGISFDSLDGEPVYIFFLLVAPVDSAGPHLKALSRVTRLLKDKFFRESLKNTKTSKDIIELIAQEDARID